MVLVYYICNTAIFKIIREIAALTIRFNGSLTVIALGLTQTAEQSGAWGMIGFLRKLWKDRRGNALVIVGAGLPVLVGAAGLATDTVQWTLWKRQLQRAADSAALAGAYEEAQGQSETQGTCSASATPAVSYDLSQNDHVGMTPTCTVTTPATWNGSSDKNAVQVTLSAQKTLGFSSLFIKTAPTITVSATATMVDDGSYCLVALNNTSSAGITIGGSAQANLGCGAISNSTAASTSIDPNGASYTFSATPVASVGGMPSSITGASNLQPFHVAEPDPYKGLYSTDVPSGTSCTGFNSHDYKDTNKKTVHYMSAGCYNDFSPSGGDTYNLDPGTYYLNNTSFNPGGSVTINGTGVTIILTGTNPGSISLDGNQTIKLSAPTSGTYKNMLFIQSSSATTNNLNKINGTSTSYFDGTIYEPTGQVQFNGSSGAMTQCAMVVGWTEDFSGNANLQNSLTRPDGSACTNATTVSGKRIRLVA